MWNELRGWGMRDEGGEAPCCTNPEGILSKPWELKLRFRPGTRILRQTVCPNRVVGILLMLPWGSPEEMV